VLPEHLRLVLQRCLPLPFERHSHRLTQSQIPRLKHPPVKESPHQTLQVLHIRPGHLDMPQRRQLPVVDTVGFAHIVVENTEVEFCSGE